MLKIISIQTPIKQSQIKRGDGDMFTQMKLVTKGMRPSLKPVLGPSKGVPKDKMLNVPPPP